MSASVHHVRPVRRPLVDGQQDPLDRRFIDVVLGAVREGAGKNGGYQVERPGAEFVGQQPDLALLVAGGCSSVRGSIPAWRSAGSQRNSPSKPYGPCGSYGTGMSRVGTLARIWVWTRSMTSPGSSMPSSCLTATRAAL